MTRNPIEHVALLTIFSSLVDGPRSVSEMPRGWPVTRAVLEAVARRLVGAGLVERATTRTRPQLRLTALGWMRAAELARTDA
jgi:DNA-binding HxlR family transcriptional regulator